MLQRTVYFFLISSFFNVAMGQSCRDTILSTTNVHQYQLNTDGTAVDRVLGIMWHRCALGQKWQNNRCKGEAILTSWENAMELAEKHEFDTYQNWRLATIHELSHITELSCQNPAISQQIFPDTPSVSFWTLTEFVNDNNLAWQVYFGSGENHTDRKSAQAAVRLVRNVNN